MAFLKKALPEPLTNEETGEGEVDAYVEVLSNAVKYSLIAATPEK